MIRSSLVWLLASAIALLHASASAQIVPDDSLGSERSSLQRDGLVNGQRAEQIQGGARRGGNLFHSFEQFNVSDGQRVYFATPDGIDRILARVTGNGRSRIDGTLGALGTADLFLLNPNGILFGENARLDVGGSFVASSAEAIAFPQFRFSAVDPQAPPLLRISVPIGLQFGVDPGGLTVRGSGHNLSYRPDFSTVRADSPGLQVGSDRTLALIGGDFTLQGGSLRAESGQIAIGSVAQPGLVGLSIASDGYQFDYGAIAQFGVVRLVDRAGVDVSGAGGGAIQVQGGQVTLRDGSALLSITQGEARGGTLSIEAADSLWLLEDAIDRPYASSITSESQGTGRSGNIVINTRRLLMRDGGLATTYNYGGGGGNIIVNATESVRLIGSGLQDSGLYAGTQAAGDSGDLSVFTDRLLDEGAALFTSTNGVGDGGNLTIAARTIVVINAQVEASTFGAGDAGNLTLRATDSIELRGTTDPTGDNPGGLFTQSNFPATGRGGQLRVETGRLSISDGSNIQVATFGEGDAGRLVIRAREIELFNSPDFQNQFDPRITSINAGSKTDINVPDPPSGNGGSLEIYTDRLSLSDNTRISNFSLGTGQAGDVRIVARSIALNDRSTITTETRSTNGGNMTLQGAVVLLQNGSTITTTAGTANAGGNGGNIAIETNFLLANPADNDITANAFTGRGGSVSIDAQGIFGMTARAALTSQSDITATSAQGIQGTVIINAPIVDPIAGTIDLPTAFSPPPLAQGCATPQDRSRFVNTGRGGLPTNPADPLVAEALWQDLGESETTAAIEPVSVPEVVDRPQSTPTEAQGWIVSPEGTVILTAAAPTATPYRIGTTVGCADE